MRWTRAPGAAAVALALAGCGGEVLDAFLSLPPTEGAATVVVGVTEGGTTRVYVGDLTSDEGLTLPLGVRSADDSPVGLAYFARTVAQAGLTPGWQLAAEPGIAAPALAEGEDAVLGAPSAVFETDLLADPPGWLRVERLAAEVSTFRPANVDYVCPVFGPPVLNEELPLATSWGVALSPSVVLLGTPSYEYVRVSRDGTIEPFSPDRLYTAGVQVDGRLYVGTASGEVLRGLPDPESVVRDEAPVGATLHVPVVSLAVGADDDIFAFLSDRSVRHFDGVAWSEWGRAADIAGSIAWIAPGEAVITSNTLEIVYHAAQGSLQVERVVGAGVLRVAHVPDVGTLGGTSEGDVLRRDEGVWRVLGSLLPEWWVLDILPQADGALLLSANGPVGRYTVARGICPELFRARVGMRGRLIPVGDEVLVVELLASQLETALVWLPAL
ncbi:MAG: hypothetical protein H6730_00655 [Deltaproteobacteria bacterium]|nr:hypothetical protein [Deltaproteobacteria bacterium]